ncbi:hypothetical protein KAT63_01400 [Candidatus Parcubacteria bacterium]|nr:hypothetical protein [Candidatus Parcubacteria bacterium]
MNSKAKQKIHIFFFILFSVITFSVGAYGIDTSILRHFDAPNHFFGGVIVGILLFEVLLPKIHSSEAKIIFTILYISVIGLGWEVFEIKAFESGLFPGALFEETAADKVSDLALGFLGFISTSYLVLEIKMKDIYKAEKYKPS